MDYLIYVYVNKIICSISHLKFRLLKDRFEESEIPFKVTELFLSKMLLYDTN